MVTIELPKRLLQLEFETLLEKTYSQDVARSRTINFDFHNVTFIPSFRMMLFILLSEYLIFEDKKKILITLSGKEKKNKINRCIHILSRLGFFDALPNEISYYPYKPRRPKNLIGANDAILEVTQIKEIKEAKKLVDLVEKAIKKNTNFLEDQVNDICLMVSEIIQNIFYHGNCNRPALIAIQRYPQQHVVQLVIADSGIGIPKTINNLEEYKSIKLSDSRAIIKSLEKGISRFGKEEGRGEGLAKCNDLAKKHLADIFIRSNNGCYRYDYSTRKIYIKDSNFLSGTQFYINFLSI